MENRTALLLVTKLPSCPNSLRILSCQLPWLCTVGLHSHFAKKWFLRCALVIVCSAQELLNHTPFSPQSYNPIAFSSPSLQIRARGPARVVTKRTSSLKRGLSTLSSFQTMVPPFKHRYTSSSAEEDLLRLATEGNLCESTIERKGSRRVNQDPVGREWKQRRGKAVNLRDKSKNDVLAAISKLRYFSDPYPSIVHLIRTLLH
jgi:hypothetical protein